MRILLDENIRASFGSLIVEHTVTHIDELGMKSISNGELLDFARNEFNVLITLDRGILYQHRHEGHDLIIAVLRCKDSTIESLQKCLKPLLAFLGQAQAGETNEIEAAE